MAGPSDRSRKSFEVVEELEIDLRLLNIESKLTSDELAEVRTREQQLLAKTALLEEKRTLLRKKSDEIRRSKGAEEKGAKGKGKGRA